MSAVRSRKDKANYKKYLDELKIDDSCQFCKFDKVHEQYLVETEHFFVVLNKFPYTKWDTQPVQEHLLIVPKQHTDSLKDLSFEASKEYVELISGYEHDGYNIYARTPGSKMKSVKHQHTHLIKIKSRQRSHTFTITGKQLFKLANRTIV